MRVMVPTPRGTVVALLSDGAFRGASYRGQMVPAMRWLVVAVVAIGVAAPPTALRLLPASGTDISAVALAAKAARATRIPWSGEVRTTGTLNVPANGTVFGGVARILGGTNDLRAWWRDPEHWRVDRIRTSGETDRVRDSQLSLTWTYEDHRVSVSPYSPIRLPDDSDVLPPTLAARLLAGAKPGELSRLPARRVAGISADGLRLVPDDPRSTIARVDLWVETSTGLPLRVDLWASHGTHPVLSTAFVSVDHAEPSSSDTSFEVSPGVDLARGGALDAAAAANAFAPFLLPHALAGLDRRGNPEDLGAVGVYGRGPTAMIVIPLRSTVASDLGVQLRHSHGARDSGARVALEVGPLSVLLVESQAGHFLLTGTVTPATLEDAADRLDVSVIRTRP